MYLGFVLALCFFVFASFARRSDLIRCIWLIVAFLALFCQGGCFMVLGGIGTATGGSDVGADKMMVPVKWAFVIGIAWCLVLIFFMLRKKDEKRAQESDDQSKNSSEEKSNCQRPEH